MADEPFIIEVEARRYAFCSCGASGSLPFCDASHSGSGQGPHIEEFTEPRRVAICGCGRSGKAPFCDGTHKNL